MLQMTGIHKAFGQNKVLTGVDFTLKEASVHALMGENGAGKSTLMKILVGIHERDKGTITFQEQAIDFKDVQKSEEAGMTFIHQELNIWPELTVLENLFIGKEVKNKFGIINEKKMKQEAKQVFDKLNFNISLNKVAGKCSIGEQQMIEIAKALMTNAKVIVMDEPTAALTDKEISQLFKLIRTLQGQGVSFVYISHRMAEIFEISDEITVMRDGKTVLYKGTKDTNYDEIVKSMVGRDLTEQFPKRTVTPGEVMMDVQSLDNDEHGIKDISFQLKQGEILGFSGLMGAGRTEIMRSLFGIDKGKKNISIKGKQVQIKSPEDAMKYGIGLITENRKDEGLLLDFSIEHNMVLPSLKSFSNKGFINEKASHSFADQMSRRLNIKTNRKALVSSLSGGNQQKVVLAKWIGTGAQVLILDEPTRGIDVGAKREIYQLMNELTERGVSIIMISSELPEVIGMSDPVVVVQEGIIKGEVENERITEENIMTLATGGDLHATNHS